MEGYQIIRIFSGRNKKAVLMFNIKCGKHGNRNKIPD